MLGIFLILMTPFSLKPAPPLSLPSPCCRLAWLNLSTAERGHGSCLDEARLEHLLALTRRSKLSIFWIEKVDCSEVRSAQGCRMSAWEPSRTTIP